MRFVIYSHPFNEDSGGNIALLLLCQRLCELGFDAGIWPGTIPYSLVPHSWREAGEIVRRGLHLLEGRRFSTGPFSVPLATRQDVEDAIVIYPEVIAGNPLRSRKVVRWFLHRPGYHTSKTRYGPDELYFFYQDAFNDPRLNPDPDNRLTVSYLHPAYKNQSRPDRSGTCVLIRKGKDRLGTIAPRGGVMIDGMSHEQAADAFNKAEFLQSLDAYSMYSVFAAMCGCTPVIEPVAGVSREQWFAREQDRYGLAYGWADLDWAIRTRPLLMEKLSRDREAEDRMVHRFVEKAQSRFGTVNCED